MARRKPKIEKGHVLFDVVYADGSRTSNRKVPVSVLGGLDGDDPARDHIEAEDTAIAEKSGRPRGPIKTIVRAGKQKVLNPGRK